MAKQVLATKICTHFNRIRHLENSGEKKDDLIGSIKSNILMIGPTGVGKTYMVKLIAKKLGVPFVKGDATKFTETGYVGGNVEDLVRDLVRETNDDIKLAQYGIVYIDEVDKLASSGNIIGHDISRSGVQRTLLKPMEDTDVELKVPHDPVSMLQEMERFQRTGNKDKQVINTANILFIMSGAFSGLTDIIKKRVANRSIGFGADIGDKEEQFDFLSKLRTEDLINYGFESEFTGRLPVRSIFEKLNEHDLFNILKNPNNPVIIGKKIDFQSYGTKIKFDDSALRMIAKIASEENTGARGIVSAIESVLLPFETALPSSNVKFFPVTQSVIENTESSIASLINNENPEKWKNLYLELEDKEQSEIRNFVNDTWKQLSLRHNLTLTQYRIDHVASYCSRYPSSIGNGVEKIRKYYDEVKQLEITFYSNFDINIIFNEDAIDFLIDQYIKANANFEEIFEKISSDFEPGLKLVKNRTEQNRFFISRENLENPEEYIKQLLSA